MKFLTLLTFLALLNGAFGSCPNACSGHGTCGSNDECNCFRNWMANDCSERVCPFGISHTTTPQGDLNMDGDRYDNTHKAIVYKTGTSAGQGIQAYVSHLDNKLVFSYDDVAANEVIVGDEIRISGYDFVVTAADPDGVTFTLDRDNTYSTDGLSGTVYKRVKTLASPGGTWESWPGDAVKTTQDEGHFYMECSNQGLCDRGTGLCECFEGYNGLACAKTACPNDCSGKGTCATISEMAVKSPLHVSNTIGVTRGSHFVSTTQSVTSLQAGDRVYLGEQSSFDAKNLYTVTRVTAPSSTDTFENSGFYVTPRAQYSLPRGSALYKSPTYNLWDANKVSGCICDAGFAGHDCSLKKCAGGHDPLDVQGEDKVNTKSSSSTTNPSLFTKRNERQMLSMDSTHGAVAGTFKLVFTDSRGVKHTSAKISATPLLTSTVRVGAPNAIDDTYCQEAHKAYMAKDHIADGFSGCYKVVYFTPDLPEGELAVGDHIRVGQDIRHVAALTRNSLTGGYSSATVSSQFSSTFGAGSYAYRHSAAGAIKAALEGLPGNACGAISASRTLSGGTPVFSATGATSVGTVSAVGDSTNAVDSGSTSRITPGANLERSSVFVGDIVRLHSNVGQMQVTALGIATDLGDVDTLDGSPRAFAHADDKGTTAGDDHDVVIRENGFSYKISFDETSGDVADLVCDSSSLRPVYRVSRAGYVSRDEPDRIYFVDVTQGSSQPAYKELTATSRLHPEAVSAGDVVYIGEQRCEVIEADDKGMANFAMKFADFYQANSIVCKDALKPNDHSTNDALYTHEPLEVELGQETVSCGSTDTPHLRFARRAVDTGDDANCVNGEGCADVFSYNGELRMVTHAAQTDSSQPDSNTQQQKNTLLDLSDLSVGDRVLIDTLGHTHEIRTVDSINIATHTVEGSNNYFTVSQPFSAAHKNKDIFLYWKGSTGSATCSGRGICDEGTGDCQCFRGYTGQACQVQNALAA